MTEVSVARIERLVSGIAKIPFGHDPKCPDGGKRPAVVAIQFVPVSSVEHNFALEAARQLEPFNEHVARIAVAVAPIAIAVTNVFIAVARIIRFAVRGRSAPQFDPGHLDVADVIIAVAWIEVVEHRFTSRKNPGAKIGSAQPSDTIIRCREGRSNFRSAEFVCLGLVRLLRGGHHVRQRGAVLGISAIT
ncbi:MAG: hypothetical protein DMF99_00935 [Acidobacteria bacterium]|nr:MAG: hypothetical protein DMF99_00935 [Acidobacteriota bacterium]